MLSYNEKTKDYFLITEKDDKAIEAGLTLSTRVRGPKGEKVWFTKSPYAALPFIGEADKKAEKKLALFQYRYMDSLATESTKEYPRPEGLEYLPFQKAGISYAIEHGNALIGDEMGLGKTIQAIGIANAIEAKKILIVCPASIRLNWQREIRKWSVIQDLKTYPILKSSDGVNPFVHYTIISYNLVRNEKIHKALCDIEWDLMVLDEAHYLKTGSAARTRAIFGGGTDRFSKDSVSRHAYRIVGLTGTPLPNRPRECYTLARALNWESIDWLSYDNFCYRYNPSAQVSTGHIIEAFGRLPELRARLRCNFMIRRLKENVLKDLPDKRYEMTYIEPNGRINEVLAKEKLIHFDPAVLFNADFFMDGQISTIRREMGEAKIPRIIEHVKYLMDVVEVRKIGLFCYHRAVMDAMKEALSDKYGLVELRGGMTTKAKQNSIDSFVEDDNIRIFSGQMNAAGVGIDGLQKVASHVVIAEPEWVPGANEQVVDRFHRYGQHDNVIAQFLIVEDSLDEKVLNIVLKKARTIHDALDKEGT